MAARHQSSIVMPGAEPAATVGGSASEPPAASQPRLRRHRRVRALSLSPAPLGEASEIVSLLADALEEIAQTTTDAHARNIAELAMATFHGR